jgi:hypothetical protein
MTALAVMVLAVWVGLRVGHPSLGPTLRAVSNDRLAQDGILLLNPFPWDKPDITQAQAQQTAMKSMPGGQIFQLVLAEVVKTNPTTEKPRLCWVASLPGSLVASYGPPGAPVRTATFNLVFIDAHTGDFVMGVAGG